MKYMVKSKILATFCAGLLTVSTGIQLKLLPGLMIKT